MNRYLKRAITYIQMIVLLIILTVPILYSAGEPLASYLLSQGRMAMIKGAPDYPHDYNYILSDLEIIKGSIANLSDINIPELNAKYGSIHCGRVELSVPLYYGDDDISLQMGAGQYPSSGLPGFGKPILISGHNSTYFAPLEQIIEGDIVTIVTEYGGFDYEVVGKLITDVKDTTVYDPSLNREQLILYTCYPFRKLTGELDKRIFFYCDPVSLQNN